jgi:hypothetical protein
MKIITFFFAFSLISSLSAQEIKYNEYKKQIGETNYKKGNIIVSVFPYGGFVMRKETNMFGYSFGHIFKYGYFIKDNLCLFIGAFQNYHHLTEELNGIKELSQTTTSTISLSMRYFVLKKRFTPYIDFGYENFINYDDWEAWDNLKPKIYSVGSVYVGIGISIPISVFNFNISYRYLHPLLYSPDSEQYNRFGFCTGWHFEPGVSFIFNKNKKALKEKYSIE